MMVSASQALGACLRERRVVLTRDSLSACLPCAPMHFCCLPAASTCCLMCVFIAQAREAFCPLCVTSSMQNFDPVTNFNSLLYLNVMCPSVQRYAGSHAMPCHAVLYINVYVWVDRIRQSSSQTHAHLSRKKKKPSRLRQCTVGKTDRQTDRQRRTGG